MRSALVLAAVGLLGCRDLSRFTSGEGVYEGTIASGTFVRTGIGDDVRMCVTLDTERLQDAPGTITTSDGRFKNTPLRPIPQLWHDPMSTLSFGSGRERNLLYVAAPIDTAAPGGPIALHPGSADVTVVVSLMQSGNVEVRLMRGASPAPASLFGVFDLERKNVPCSF
jgi:hypothetical protein